MIVVKHGKKRSMRLRTGGRRPGGGCVGAGQGADLGVENVTLHARPFIK